MSYQVCVAICSIYSNPQASYCISKVEESLETFLENTYMNYKFRSCTTELKFCFVESEIVRWSIYSKLDQVEHLSLLAT